MVFTIADDAFVKKIFLYEMGFEPMRFATTDLETVSLTTRTLVPLGH